MKCPSDGVTTLVMSDRQGVEIDYCPVCRGVWLDRGELDKIIDRVSESMAPTQADDQAPPVVSVATHPPAPRPMRNDDDDRYYEDDRRPRKKKKRSSFLEDMFDFGG